MSETYTIGGDNWQPLMGFDISAQTFTPVESHIVDYIDINLWLSSTTPPNVSLWQCAPSHEPVGPMLTEGHITEPLFYLPPAKRRVRYKLNPPVYLTAGTIYSIWVRKDIGHVGPNDQWLYDKDDATYPRGHIIFSDDGGHTWTHFLNSDFIFCEFGTPPLPELEPPPPIKNFAVLDLIQRNMPDGIIISLPTNVPCHLTCYWTDIKPRTHRTSRYLRGIREPWGAYFCFVSWHFVEQTEPGDTLYHTFHVIPWPEYETRWVTFRGEVDNILSPSVGPVFEKFRFPYELPEVLFNLSFEEWPDPALNPFFWSRFYFGTGSSEWIRREIDVYHGNYAARFKNTGYARGCGFRQVQDATPWRGLNLTFKAWGSGYAYSNNDLTVGVNGTGGWTRHATLPAGADWRQVSLSGIIPWDATEISISIRGYCGPLYSASTSWDFITVELT